MASAVSELAAPEEAMAAAALSAASSTPPSGLEVDSVGEDKRTKRGFSKRVTLGDLERYFEYPIEEVSRMMGVSTTIIKRLCRKYGIKRWPYRQIRSVNKSIKYLELLARPAEGPDRQRLQEQLVSLHYKKQLIRQAATSGASAAVRKSILQMRPDQLDAENNAQMSMCTGGVCGGSGAGALSGEMSSETGEVSGAAASAATVMSVNPTTNMYGIPMHLSMAGMAMGYSPYVHMATVAQVAQAQQAAFAAATAGG
ncbi:unnamed protein product, partial [Discosporangium mesarthrocarpum]